MTSMSIKSCTAAALLAACAVGQAATIRFQTVGVPVAGRSFDVQVRLEDPFAGLAPDEQLLAFGFHVHFDASQLALDSFLPAAGWEDDSAHLGSGIFSASTFPGIDNAGQPELLLATLHFDALQAGAASFSLGTDAGDPNQGLIFLESDPVAMTGTDSLTVAAAVPEPASVLLMTAALAGFAAWRRRAGTAAR